MRAKEEDFERIIAVNQRGAFSCMKAASRHLLRAKASGRVINISSVVGERGNPGQTMYAASKAAILGMTKSVAQELAGRGITVNAISPGWIPVERHVDDPEEDKQAYLDIIPMQRWGVPKDMAGATIFLASDASSFVTGQNIHVNGGTILP